MNYEGKKNLKSTDFVPGGMPDLPEFTAPEAISIPDLEKEDSRPTNYDKQHAANVAKGISTADKIEDKISKDIQDSQAKFKGVPSHPKDILKSIIAKGEYKETVHLFGVDWTLRALDQGDLLFAFDEVKDNVSTLAGRMTTLEFAKVVFSIEAINNTTIYELFDEIKMSDYPNKMVYIITVKKALQRYLEAFPPDLIDMLVNAYAVIDMKRMEAIAELKNS